jgi:hypothetical protein
MASWLAAIDSCDEYVAIGTIIKQSVGCDQ